MCEQAESNGFGIARFEYSTPRRLEKRGTMFTKIAILAAAALSLMVSSASAEGKIVVGAYAANPPWEYKNEAGTFEGFEVEVAAEVAKRLGMDVDFQPLGFQALFAATASGRIDFAISSISINNERLKSQSFTQPYYDSDGTIVGKAGSTVKTLEDLKGKVIGVVAATTGEAWAKENAEKYGIAEVKSYAAQQDLLLDVQNGRIEGGAGELAGFQYAITKIPALKILVRIPTGERFAMMAKKDLPILAKVNDTISEMKKDGTMAAIHKKWFGVEPDAGTSTVTPMPIPTAQ
jgi:polar amino acid transport system substrate-binding protein